MLSYELDLTWYKANGYKSDIPKGINEKSSDEEILAMVKSNFKEEDYEDYADKLIKDFLLMEKNFSQSHKKSLSRPKNSRGC